MKMIVQTHELKLIVQGKEKEINEFINDLQQTQYIVKKERIIEGGDKLLTVIKGIEKEEITIADLKDMKIIDVEEHKDTHCFRIIVEIKGKKYDWLFVIP
jgi:hypothetical protein